MRFKIFIKSYKQIHAGWDRMSKHDILDIWSWKNWEVHSKACLSWVWVIITCWGESNHDSLHSSPSPHRYWFCVSEPQIQWKHPINQHLNIRWMICWKQMQIRLMDDLCVHRPSVLNDVPPDFTHTCLNFFPENPVCMFMQFYLWCKSGSVRHWDYSTVKQILTWRRTEDF